MIGNNIRKSVTVALIMATLYSAYVLLLFLVSGSAPFDNHGTTVQAVVLTYYVVGAAGGLVVGVMLPLTRSWLGGIGVGIVAAFIVFFGFYVITEGPFWRWEQEVWLSLGIAAAIFGVAGSLIMRKLSGW
jgi:hypothetical protein